MIEIAIDEGACVSCSLCVDVCPTEVLSFDEARNLPKVVNALECFGCLSCSEICPSQCIDHKGVTLAESYYHDPYTIRLASRLASNLGGRLNIPSDDESRRKALADLGVRVLSVAEVFKRTLGSSLPAVGTMAGRTLAGHLPRYRAPRSLSDALEMAMMQLAPAWQMDCALNGDQMRVQVGRCFVREVCANHGLELGGELCVLFYHYLAGFVGKLGRSRLKLTNASRGSQICVYEILVYHQA